MTIEKIEVSVTLPRLLWEQLLQRAHTEHETETVLLTRAIEHFLQQEKDKLALAQRLERECEALAQMDFNDEYLDD